MAERPRDSWELVSNVGNDAGCGRFICAKNPGRVSHNRRKRRTPCSTQRADYRVPFNAKIEHRENMSMADGSKDGPALFDSSNGDGLGAFGL